MKKKTNILITSECVLRDKSNYENILLGRWCLHNNEKLKSLRSVNYHWDDRKKILTDYVDLNDLYKLYLSKLSHYLNDIHNESYTTKYWEVVIGPWLRSFLVVMWDRWEIINTAESEYTNIEINYNEIDFEKLIPIDTSDYFYLISSNEWNRLLFKDIFCYKKKGFSENIKLNEKKHKILNKSKLKQKIFMFLKDKFYYFLNNIHFLRSKRKNTIVIVDQIFKLKSLIKIFFSNYNLFIVDPPKEPKFKTILSKSRLVNRFLNNVNFEFKDKQFINYLNKRINLLIPTSVIENYKKNVEFMYKQNWPRSPLALLSSYGFYENEIKKIYIAESVDKGSKNIIYQHGGNYGTNLFSVFDDHELSIADIFLSWGWTKIGAKNIIKFNCLNFIEKKKFKKDSKKKDIIMPLMALPLFSNNLYSIPIGYNQLDKYFQDQIRFINKIDRKYSSNISLRLHNCDQLYKLNSKSTWFKNININYDNNYSMSKSLNKCKLAVCSYNGTTFLETLSKNIPTIIFWDQEYWELNNKTKPFFDALYNVNIFHFSPESAANFINKNYDLIEDWWFDLNTQNAVKRFCKEFVNTSNDPINSFSKILNYISS